MIMLRACRLFLLAPILVFASSDQNQELKPLVFTHVTVIDAKGAQERSDMTVVITGDRITALGKADNTVVPEGAQVVDGRRKFLIPGLWDMHVHLVGKKEVLLPLLIANGVTGVRDMGVPMEQLAQIQQWRREIAAGTLLGPRILTPGPILTGPRPARTVWPGSLAVSDAQEARDAVNRLLGSGVDFVKVHNAVPREAYFAIADECKKRGIPFAGHTPDYISAAEASDAGQRSIEHLSGILVASSTEEPALRKELMEVMPTADLLLTYRSRRHIETESLATFSKNKAATLLARFVRNGTWQAPTLVNLRQNAFPDRTDPAEVTFAKYIPRPLRERTKEIKDAILKELNPEDFSSGKPLYQKQMELMTLMKSAGVKFLAGTDMPLSPGFTLHEELSLLVQAGLTPMEALQSATRNPAEYFGMLDSVGTIEKGKIADLVLLQANPLQDISNTRNIDAIVVGGRLVPKSFVQDMLAKVEAVANE